MKQTSLLMKRVFTSGFLSVMILATTTAQDLGSILKAGIEDANTYLDGYLAPAMNSLGVGLTGGWNHTAKPHKLLGFDIGFTMNVAGIPSSDKNFAFNSRQWQNLTYNGTEPIPTFVGGNASGQFVIPANTVITNPQTQEQIIIPNDIPFDVLNGIVDMDDIPLPVVGFPTPSIQLGIGLPKNTDIKFRFLPGGLVGGSDDFSLNYFGIGILHDIKQWIPGMKLMPIDLSAFYGFTTFALNQNINFTDVSNSSQGTVNSTTTFTADGSAQLYARASTFQILASKKLALFTPFVSVGFNAVNTGVDVKGDFEYTVSSTETTTNQTNTETLNFVDPIALTFAGAGGPRMSVGGRLKILVLTIHAEYVIQQYNMFTAGVGIALR